MDHLNHPVQRSPKYLFLVSPDAARMMPNTTAPIARPRFPPLSELAPNPVSKEKALPGYPGPYELIPGYLLHCLSRTVFQVSGQYNTGAQYHLCYPNCQRYFLLFPARRRTIPLDQMLLVHPASFPSSVSWMRSYVRDKAEIDSTMNCIPITVGSTQNVSDRSSFKPGILWALSTKKAVHRTM